MAAHVQIEELAPGMRPAPGLGDALRVRLLVPRIGIRHQGAQPRPQKRAGVRARSALAKVIDGVAVENGIQNPLSFLRQFLRLVSVRYVLVNLRFLGLEPRI